MNNPALKFDHIHIISQTPRESAEWYVKIFGATIAAETVSRNAPQVFVEIGGMTIIIRGQRPGEAPAAAAGIRQYEDYASHNEWGADHFGFLYEGDLEAFCQELREKGVTFPVELKESANGSKLCYVSAPDGVSIELMQC